MTKCDRVGETSYDNYGKVITLIEYNNSQNVLVEFENGYITKVQYNAFKEGMITNPYYKTIFNVGFVGEGDKTRENGKITNKYNIWRSMLERCYDEKHRDRHLSYKGCTVCEEWHCFQNFAKWYDENYYTVNDEQMCLDKDILIKDNKVYSPETCIFVPARINLLFTKCDSKRGKYPIGVNYKGKQKNKYQVNCSIYDKKTNKPKRRYLGSYSTSIKAFNIYKEFKGKYIKIVAEEYKDQIPTILYNAMYKWEVKITD